MAHLHLRTCHSSAPAGAGQQRHTADASEHDHDEEQQGHAEDEHSVQDDNWVGPILLG